MIVLAVLVGFLALAASQAGYWVYRSRLERHNDLLRDRLSLFQVPVAQLLREKERFADLSLLIEQAGFRYGTQGFFVRAAGLSIVSVIAGGVFATPFVAMAGIPFGPLLLWTRLQGLRRKRIARIAEQMPRALEVLVLTLRSGQALPRAIAAVAEDVADPLRGELRRVAEEHGLGRPIEEAFVALEERLKGCMSVRLLVTSVLVLSQTGGNLIDVIERIVETLSSEEQYKQRLRVATAEGRTSAYFVAFVPLGLLAYRLGFDERSRHLFVDTTLGHALLLISGALWICGVISVRRITRPLHGER
jgi:tight adherence protein B